jgi:hypothetical protein
VQRYVTGTRHADDRRRAATSRAPGRRTWSTAVARRLDVPGRRAVLRDQRRDARPAMVSGGADLRRTAAAAGVRRRFAPHQLRHAHAVEMAHEGVPLIVIQRQLGHSNLGITSIYLQGIDNAEIIDTVHARRAPMSQSARSGSDERFAATARRALRERAAQLARPLLVVHTGSRAGNGRPLLPRASMR